MSIPVYKIRKYIYDENNNKINYYQKFNPTNKPEQYNYNNLINNNFNSENNNLFFNNNCNNSNYKNINNNNFMFNHHYKINNSNINYNNFNPNKNNDINNTYNNDNNNPFIQEMYFNKIKEKGLQYLKDPNNVNNYLIKQLSSNNN